MAKSKPKIDALVKQIIARVHECSPEQLAEISVAINRIQHMHP